MPAVIAFLWSRRRESNPQPADYKSAALPLSYVGKQSILFLSKISIAYFARIVNLHRASAEGFFQPVNED